MSQPSSPDKAIGSRGEQLTKVIVRLNQGVDGYPPASSEGLWAEDLGEGHFRIHNIPFFAPDLSIDDIVHADHVGGELVVAGYLSSSGHSTIRVVIFDRQRMDGMRDALDAFGCTSELSHIPTLLAIDVPPDVPIQVVRAFLDGQSTEGTLDYEESAIRHLG